MSASARDLGRTTGTRSRAAALREPSAVRLDASRSEPRPPALDGAEGRPRRPLATANASDDVGLTDKDILRIHAVLNACHELTTLEDFKTFIATQVRGILAHQIAVCGLGEIRSHRILRLINIDFPTGYLERVIRPDRVLLSSPLRDWLAKRTPMIFRLDDAVDREVPLRYPGARLYGITSLACHGFVDVTSTVYSYFAFGQLDPRQMASYPTLLNLIVPHLHAILTRLLTTEHLARTGVPADDGPAPGGPGRERPTPRLIHVTDREQQVLHWIAAGKSNWEIGKILRISEFTAKNHVQSILRKLSVTSRAQAVSTAIFCGLITDDVGATDAADFPDAPPRRQSGTGP